MLRNEELIVSEWALGAKSWCGWVGGPQGDSKILHEVVDSFGCEALALCF